MELFVASLLDTAIINNKYDDILIGLAKRKMKQYESNNLYPKLQSFFISTFKDDNLKFDNKTTTSISVDYYNKVCSNYRFVGKNERETEDMCNQFLAKFDILCQYVYKYFDYYNDDDSVIECPIMLFRRCFTPREQEQIYNNRLSANQIATMFGQDPKIYYLFLKYLLTLQTETEEPIICCEIIYALCKINRCILKYQILTNLITKHKNQVKYLLDNIECESEILTDLKHLYLHNQNKK